MAVRFDTTADRLSYGAVSPPSTFTITAWVYLSVDRSTWSTFLQLRDSGDGFVCELASPSGTSGPTYFDGSGTLDNSTGFVVGEWRKVAVTRTGSSGKLYIATEGGSTELDSGTVTTGTPTSITLGSRGPNDSGQWWNGRLAFVRVWDSVLTQVQIEAEWGSSTPVITSGIWADWPLTTASTLTDTVNGRTLTVAAGGVLTTEASPDPSGGSITGAFAGSLGSLSTVGGTWAGAEGTPGVLAGSLPALAALGGSFTNAVAAAGRWHGGVPTRPGRYKAGQPT